jgi:tRNA(His) 5'-end guanylyltransferase
VAEPAELQATAEPLAVHLARLAPMAFSATAAQLATAEPGDLVLQELMARLCLLMVAQAVQAELVVVAASVELQVAWEAWPGQTV